MALAFAVVPGQPAHAAASASTTGVPSGTSLTTVYGDIRVTTAGTVISGKDIHGRVIIKAANVTIKNSIVRGTDAGGKYGLVDNMGNYSGLKVIDTEIVATKPNWTVNGIMGSNFSLQRVEIHNTVDQVSITGSNVSITDSWLHGSLWYSYDADHSDGSHNDNIEITGGSNIALSGNTFADADNAALMVTQDRAKVSNLTVSGNRISGGDCSINVSEKGKGAILGFSVKSNTFAADTTIKHCAIVAPTTTKISLSGNTFLDGFLVSVLKG
ncbi:hypothetical protein [Naasia lichenicola]|uniref:Right handed beta helix domain-containing protein n=1 Tax=Naasia lichenicola TaxID=2565933 RepID=A0A4S4FNH8_9MICO|nr:hypothetical protein [Naasia lichenicola]THG30792.1 hypothetical protein E6C64_09140 [Naasia lichenicola]THG32029.1 hypothetical protein E6C64_08285 [Naasia lichenicola]